MKISQLEQVLEVAKAGSISQAAANLYMGQPNISLTIKSVEKEMGITIFERTSTGVNLTHDGRDFIERVKEIMMQLDALEDIYTSKPKKEKPVEMQIASLTHRVVNIEISKLIEKYKDRSLKIDLITALGTKLLDAVEENRAEIGFCTVYAYSKKVMMRQIAMRRLEYHFIGETVPGIYVGINNKRFSDKDKIVDFDKLKDMCVVELGKREFNAQTIADYLYKEGISFEINKLITVSNFGELRSMLNLVDGFSVASYFDISYEPYGYYTELRFIPFSKGLLTSEFGYVQRQNSILSPITQELLDSVIKNFNK